MYSKKGPQPTPFLPPAQQREVLKTVLSSTLKSKYPSAPPQMLSSRLSSILKPNLPLTADHLKKLDADLQKMSGHNNENGNTNKNLEIANKNDKKGNENLNNNNVNPNKNARNVISAPGIDQDGEFDHDSAHSEKSRMSGASNFEVVDKLCTKRLEAKEDKAKKSEKLIISENPPPNHLSVLNNEQNEWAAIMKFNAYLYHKEDDVLRLQAKKRQKEFCNDLSRQIKEKEEVKKKERELEGKYFENVRNQIREEEERDKKKIEEYKRKIALEKETRDRQLKENHNKKKFEIKQEKALDGFLIQSLKVELRMASELEKAQKEHKAKVMYKILQDANRRKEEDRMNELYEKEETIRLQEAYYNLIEEQEKTKEDNMKKRDRLAKEFLDNSSAMKTKNQLYLNEMQKMQERNEKYAVRLEKQKQQEEQEKILTLKNQKVKNKEILLNQIKEKENRNNEEKRIYNQEQMTMWQKDTEQYFEFENNKQKLKNDNLVDYRNWIKEKIEEKKKNKIFDPNQSTKYEELINNQAFEDRKALLETNNLS